MFRLLSSLFNRRWQEHTFGIHPRSNYNEQDCLDAAFINGRRGSTQMRINTSRHQVRTRIELRRVFDGLVDRSMYSVEHRVSCKELILAIRFSENCRELFKSSLLAKGLPEIFQSEILFVSGIH
jgi:hypothetical protein